MYLLMVIVKLTQAANVFQEFRNSLIDGRRMYIICRFVDYGKKNGRKANRRTMGL